LCGLPTEKLDPRFLPANGMGRGLFFGLDRRGIGKLEHFHTRWNHRGFRNGVEM
jgi:hypothetical protein